MEDDLLVGLGYARLSRVFRKGIRNHRWFALSSVEKALLRAAKGYCRKAGEIISPELLKALFGIIKKLTSSVKREIWQKGVERGREMRMQFEESGAFEWCPRMKDWLEDLDYIFYLGLESVNSAKLVGRF